MTEIAKVSSPGYQWLHWRVKEQQTDTWVAVKLTPAFNEHHAAVWNTIKKYSPQTFDKLQEVNSSVCGWSFRGRSEAPEFV